MAQSVGIRLVGTSDSAGPALFQTNQWHRRWVRRNERSYTLGGHE